MCPPLAPRSSEWKKQLLTGYGGLAIGEESAPLCGLAWCSLTGGALLLEKGCGGEKDTQEPATPTSSSAKSAPGFTPTPPREPCSVSKCCDSEGLGRNGRGPFSKFSLDQHLCRQWDKPLWKPSFKGVIVYICVNSRTQWCQRGSAECSTQARLGHQRNEYQPLLACFSPFSFFPTLQHTLTSSPLAHKFNSIIINRWKKFQ